MTCGLIRGAGKVLAGLLVAATAYGAAGGGKMEFDPSTASLDELFFHFQRYATTDTKKEHKRLAREELEVRGGETLAFLLERARIENLWIHVLARVLVDKLPADEAVPVLLEGATAEEIKTRVLAIYLLGFYDVPAHADRVIPALSVDKTAGAAVRTLGKWRVAEAVPLVLPFLDDPKERRRVTAVNALGEIKDPQTASYLFACLQDQPFTVRKAALCALSGMGGPVEDETLRRLTDSGNAPQRELIELLGAMRSRRAVRMLRRLLRHSDRATREDAARALHAIDPRRAEQWTAREGIDLAELVLRPT